MIAIVFLVGRRHTNNRAGPAEGRQPEKRDAGGFWLSGNITSFPKAGGDRDITGNLTVQVAHYFKRHLSLMLLPAGSQTPPQCNAPSQSLGERLRRKRSRRRRRQRPEPGKPGAVGT